MIRTAATWFKRACIAGIVVILAAVVLLPERTAVTSNADDDLIWRQLPTTTTTTTVRTSTTTTPTVRPSTDGDAWFIVVDGGRAYKIPRTAMTVQLLWLATAIEVE